MDEYILTDVDDSVVIYSEILQEYTEKLIGQRAHTPLISTYHLEKAFDITVEKSYEICQQFWNSDLFLNLPAMPCSKVIIPKLKRRGFKFVAVTACSDSARTRNGRMQNLRREFGFDWTAIHCTFETGKALHLGKYPPSNWVEDHVTNCKLGSQFGHSSYLLTRDHNIDDHEPHLYRRVKDWRELEALL